MTKVPESVMFSYTLFKLQYSKVLFSFVVIDITIISQQHIISTTNIHFIQNKVME